MQVVLTSSYYPSKSNGILISASWSTTLLVQTSDVIYTCFSFTSYV